tara:strand:- start:1252 stop:3411 length:2160 start_codon:yes stop_codon:yes gene_type:complete
MSTFYGYAERQAEDQVDWSVIGKEITTMLQTEVTRRDKLKADIDKESKKYGETLANAPTGQHKGASDGVLEFASNLEQARLVQDRLLKSGQLKVKDYLQQRQNLTDGTTGLFAAAKEFQAAYAGKLKAMAEGTASGAEIELFKMTEAFGNWNKVGAYINPTNYQVSLGKKHRVKQADGSYVYQMGEKPDEYFTVAELRNFISLDLPKFDTKGVLDKAAESLGERDLEITFATYDNGQKGTRTLKVSDITGEVLKKLKAKNLLTEDQINLIDKYHDYQDAIVNDITANPYNALSVLTDYVGVAENGKKFEYVWSEEAAKGRPEAVYFEKDPQAGAPRIIFHDKQEEYIKGKLKQGLDQRLDQKTTDTFTPEKVYSSRSNYTPPKWKVTRAEAKNYADENILTRVEDFIAQGFDGKYNNLEFFNNSIKGKAVGLGVKKEKDENNNDIYNFVIEREKGQYITILSDLNNKTPYDIANAILASNHFEFFPAGLRGAYNLTTDLAKRLSKDLQLEPFGSTGELPYIETKVEEGVGEQQSQSGTKQTSSKSYSTVIKKKKSESGGVDQTNANAVGQTLKSSYFTSQGPMANIFNDDNVIMTTLTAQQVGKRYPTLDNTYTSWSDPKAKYQAILIKPGPDQSFKPVLLPVAKIFNSDFNLVMDMIAKEMEGGDIYDMDDIKALFTSKNKMLEKYLNAIKPETTTKTTEAETTDAETVEQIFNKKKK